MYWHWHSIHNAIESYWKGVLSHDFSENETYREACRIGKEWKQIGTHLINLQKENHVAVLVDNHSLTVLSHFPLDAYAANGGNLIVTFRSGFSDEQLKIYSDMQPHILHKCLGIHYDQFTYPKDVAVVLAEDWIAGTLQSAASDDSPQTAAIRTDTAHDWMELVTCDTAKMIATYEHPAWNRYAAVAENSYGKGTALYLGAFFGDELLEEILRTYLSKTGYPTLANEELHFPVILKRGQNDFEKELYYYFNYSGEKQTVAHIGDSGVELLSEKAVASQEVLTLAPWDLAIVKV